MWVISVELPGTTALWSQIFGGQNVEPAVQTVELRYRIEIQRYRDVHSGTGPVQTR